VIWAVAVSIGFTEVFADGNNPMSHPKASEVVPVGEPYDIEWNPKTPGPVKITLHYGNNVPLQNITRQYSAISPHSLLYPSSSFME